LIEPKKKRKKSKDQHDPVWAKAKALCRLNMEDIRMAKELGMSPRSLMKNVPSPTQPWKASVKFWIRGLYAKRQEKTARRHPPDPRRRPDLQRQINHPVLKLLNPNEIRHPSVIVNSNSDPGRFDSFQRPYSRRTAPSEPF
jgi:hypothetical protein